MEKVSIKINNISTERLENFNLTMDIYEPDNPFSFTIANDSKVKPSDYIEIIIDNERLFYGIIDRVEKSYSKASFSKYCSGRGLIGLISDEYIKTFSMFRLKNLQYVATSLLSTVPIVKTKCTISFEGDTSKVNYLQDLKPNPGDTVFGFLSGICLDNGIVFYCDSFNVIKFTRPIRTGMSKYNFQVVKTAESYENKSNILDARYVKDCSQHYRYVRVMGQYDENVTGIPDVYTYQVTADCTDGGKVSIDKQSIIPGAPMTPIKAIPNSGYTFIGWSGDFTGAMNPLTMVITADRHFRANFLKKGVANYSPNYSSDGTGTFNFKCQLIDDTAPIEKTRVINYNKKGSPQNSARNEIEQQRLSAEQLQYTVSGFKQNGLLYKINELAKVRDDALGVNGDYLIYRLEFSLSKQEGARTMIYLSRKGEA